jgi:hypothetical protein
MRAAGVDGCPGGWLCVTREAGGALASVCFPNAEALLAQRPRPDLLAIDVPIGLLEHGARECDRAARAFLGPRRNSVLTAPLRAMLPAESWAEACAIRERVERKRITQAGVGHRAQDSRGGRRAAVQALAAAGYERCIPRSASRAGAARHWRIPRSGGPAAPSASRSWLRISGSRASSRGSTTAPDLGAEEAPGVAPSARAEGRLAGREQRR